MTKEFLYEKLVKSIEKNVLLEHRINDLEKKNYELGIIINEKDNKISSLNLEISAITGNIINKNTEVILENETKYTYDIVENNYIVRRAKHTDLEENLFDNIESILKLAKRENYNIKFKLK